jgi:hypothetical protein
MGYTYTPSIDMAFNMYKQIAKIRTTLEEKGFTRDIPTEQFIKQLMLLFGMRKKKAIEWLHTYEDVNLIEIKDDVINFR